MQDRSRMRDALEQLTLPSAKRQRLMQTSAKMTGVAERRKETDNDASLLHSQESFSTKPTQLVSKKLEEVLNLDRNASKKESHSDDPVSRSAIADR